MGKERVLELMSMSIASIIGWEIGKWLFFSLIYIKENNNVAR